MVLQSLHPSPLMKTKEAKGIDEVILLSRMGISKINQVLNIFIPNSLTARLGMICGTVG